MKDEETIQDSSTNEYKAKQEQDDKQSSYENISDDNVDKPSESTVEGNRVGDVDAYMDENNEDEEENTGNNQVAVIVGKWAMPTTVMLVLITCMSGFFLSETAFTPVVGMIAPVVMALIMVIKEASVGKDQDPGLKDRDGERRERFEQSRQEKEVKIAQMELDERLKNQAFKEQARQVDMFHASTRDFVDLIKEMNNKITVQMSKPKSTELAIGDTKIKISDGGTSVATKEQDQQKNIAEK